MARFKSDRERMKAGLRWVSALVAAGLALAPAAALAQDAPDSNQSAGTVGPRELQNFSLGGTVTRPAETPPTQSAPPRVAQPRVPEPELSGGGTSSASTTTGRAARQAERRDASEQAKAPAPVRTEDVAVSAAKAPTRQASAAPASSARPPIDVPAINSAAAPKAASSNLPAADEVAAASLAPEHKFPILPWLLAALALGAGGAFLFWRNRSREPVALGPQFSAFAPPEPAPTPAPKPAVAPAPSEPRLPVPPVSGLVTTRSRPSIPGLVSTRLRPSIEIGFYPLRCIVEDEKVTFEFDLELLNSGKANARGVLVEASLFNASTEQEQVLANFFQNPVGEGQRIAAIEPAKRFSIRTKVETRREHVQIYEVGGRQVFVPLIAFNSLYSWSGGEGQSSVAFLLGIDTNTPKMAPFRVDQGSRIFTKLASQPLPTFVRT
jgi:hypothetical protein